MKINLFAGASVGLCILASANAVSAQSIDYGAMQQLFNEPVTTSATGAPQRAPAAPADMQIISAAEIKRSGAQDLPSLLSRVAGLDVLRWSATGADVSVRGYNQPMSPRLLVLINGRQVYLDHYGYTAWATLPVQLAEIRQIEVVKGPNSALFGFNAVGGVVNIITVNPKYDATNVATVRVGDGGVREGSLVYSARLGPSAAARVSLAASEANEWANSSGLPASQRHDPAKVSANVDVLVDLAPKTELRVEASTSNALVTDVTSNASYSASKYLTSSGKVSLASETRLGTLEGQLYRNNLTVKYRLTAGIPATYDNEITVFSLQDLFKVGTKHTFRLGVEQRHNTVNTAPLTGGDISYSVTAFSGMWNWEVSDKVSLTSAVRSDKLSLKREGKFPAGFPKANNALWDRDINETSYNLGAVWKVTPVDTLKITTARGVQLPTLIDLGGLQLYYQAGPFTLAVLGNPSLEPTVVTNHALSYDRDLPAINGRVGIKLFKQQTDSVKAQLSSTTMDIAPTLTTLPGLTFRNAGDSKMSGVEVSGSAHYANGFRWSGDYTWTDVKDHPLAGVNLNERLVAYGAMTPKGRGNLIVGYEKDAWNVDAHLRYVDDFRGFTSTAIVPVKSYTTLSAYVSRSFGQGFTLGLRGDNLLKDNQRQTSGLLAERRLVLSLTKVW